VETFACFTDWFEGRRGEADAVVLDIDGVLMCGGEALPGAARLMQALRAAACPFSLLTNDAHHSHAEKARWLAGAGLDAREGEILSCADGLVDLCAERGLAGRRFFLAGNLGTPCYARLAGLEVTREPAELGACAGVILGEENYDWELAINAAVNFFLAKPGGLLVVPNPDVAFRAADARIRLASGAPAQLIQYALGVCGVKIEPIWLGKPYPPIFARNHRVLESTAGRRLDPGRVLMLGDSLTSDVCGSRGFGYRSALVMTGVTRHDMLAASPVLPDLVFERL